MGHVAEEVTFALAYKAKTCEDNVSTLGVCAHSNAATPITAIADPNFQPAGACQLLINNRKMMPPLLRQLIHAVDGELRLHRSRRCSRLTATHTQTILPGSDQAISFKIHHAEVAWS